MPHVSTIPANQLTRQPGTEGRTPSIYGTLGRLACRCSQKNDMDFLIKQDRIICASCGNEILCLPPLVGVYQASCNCCFSAAVKSTFVLDSRGIYICTWCGRTR
jgi:hypothetical protein